MLKEDFLSPFSDLMKRIRNVLSMYNVEYREDLIHELAELIAEKLIKERGKRFITVSKIITFGQDQKDKDDYHHVIRTMGIIIAKLEALKDEYLKLNDRVLKLEGVDKHGTK